MLNKSTLQIKTYLFHALFWLLYALSEYLADYPHLKDSEHIYLLRSVMLSLPLLIVPTYFIVLFAVPRYLKKGKTLPFLILILLTAAVVFYGRIKWLELVNYINYDFSGAMPAGKVAKNLVRDYSIIALATALYIIADWKKKEQENKYLLKAKAQSDLELLKRQLHPHFLFNTLNNIYSLSLKNSDQTVDSILKLSRLLEYLVYQSGKKQVSLQEEIDLVRNYIDLEKLRYGKGLDTQLDIEGVDNQLKTAPLILLPFVENCFKHGEKNDKGLLWIKIRIRLFEKLLTIFVENSINKNARSDSGITKGTKAGVGLSNISDRLELLYPQNYSLIFEESDEFYSVKLELKLE